MEDLIENRTLINIIFLFKTRYLHYPYGIRMKLKNKKKNVIFFLKIIAAFHLYFPVEKNGLYIYI